MDEYTLIELNTKSGTKNIICQLLAPRQTISLENVEETRSYVVAIDDAVRYCFTCNPNILDPDSKYVVLTDRAPSKQKLLEGTVQQKKWLKHPKMAEHTAKEVLDSWTNEFVYKEEVDEEHPGLRKPQLGALVMPLCRVHHGEYHTLGKTEFESRYHVVPVPMDRRIAGKYNISGKAAS